MYVQTFLASSVLVSLFSSKWLDIRIMKLDSSLMR